MDMLRELWQDRPRWQPESDPEASAHLARHQRLARELEALGVFAGALRDLNREYGPGAGERPTDD